MEQLFYPKKNKEGSEGLGEIPGDGTTKEKKNKIRVHVQIRAERPPKNFVSLTSTNVTSDQ